MPLRAGAMIAAADQRAGTTEAPSRALMLAAGVIFAAVLGLRLALIFTGRVTADAEECVLGLMARHVLAGKGHLLDFLGPGVGPGAGLEAYLLSLIFALAGSSSVAIKLVGLALWSGLVLVSWRLSRALFDRRTGALTLLLLAAAPTTALWAMKVRGGYLSAPSLFLAAGLLSLPLLTRSGAQGPRKKFMALPESVGLLAGLSVWLQPLTAAGVLVLLASAAVILGTRRQWAILMRMIAAPLVMGAIVFFLLPSSAAPLTGTGTGDYLPPPSIFVRLAASLVGFFTPHLDANILDQPEQDLLLLAAQLSAALLWSAVFLLALVWSGANWRRIQSRQEALAIGLVLAVIGATLVGVALAGRTRLEPRHFLTLYPLTGIIIARMLENMSQDHPGLSRTLLGLLILSGLAVSASFLAETKFYNPGSPTGLTLESTPAALQSLHRHGVKGVFCADAEFKWNLMFESGEEFPARSWNPVDMYPEYVAAANRAALRDQPVAVVIPNPDLPERRDLLDQILSGPYSQKVYTSPDVVIVYGVPQDYVFLYFPLKIPGR